MIALDRKAFEHALTRWVEALLSRPIAAAASLPEAYALDGKSGGRKKITGPHNEALIVEYRPCSVREAEPWKSQQGCATC